MSILTIRDPAPYWPETGNAHTTSRAGDESGDVLFMALRATDAASGAIAGMTTRCFEDGQDGGYELHRAVVDCSDERRVEEMYAARHE